MLTQILQLAAHSAVFGVLCILDGSRAVESTSEKGRFELRFVKGTSVSVVSGSQAPEPLHEFLGPIW